MPRRQFVADFNVAVGETASWLGSGISLERGEDDGSFKFKLNLLAGGTFQSSIEVHALIADIGDYPTQHQYAFWSTSENFPEQMLKVLEDTSEFEGLSVLDTLSKLLKFLDNAMNDKENSDAGEEDEDHDDAMFGLHNNDHRKYTQNDNSEEDTAPLSHLRDDLRAVKSAGFRVSYLKNLQQHLAVSDWSISGSFITISCRISRLGISDDVLEAWDLEKNRYLILVIQTNSRHPKIESLLEDDSYHSRPKWEMRVGTSHKYKITEEEILRAFSKKSRLPDQKDDEGNQELGSMKISSPQSNRTNASTESKKENAPKVTEGFRSLFISDPLEDLLNTRFLDIVRYRIALKSSWSAGEAIYNEVLDCHANASQVKIILQEHSRRGHDSKPIKSLSELVTGDHLQETWYKTSEISAPLLAMQYTLRHLVRCTEFCLVCHREIDVLFEAMRPYVCDKPLCLYQYMVHGFGPKVEHEIMSQPDVVDLLVCFCYASASAGKLDSFPTGMGLMVLPTSYNQKTGPSTCHKAHYDEKGRKMTLKGNTTALRVGDWVCVSGIRGREHHHRVMDVMGKDINLGAPVELGLIAPTASMESKDTPEPRDREFWIYDQDFDNLPETAVETAPAPSTAPFPMSGSYNNPVTAKHVAVCRLLETLPSIKVLKEYLTDTRAHSRTLKDWSERISPSALGVLRWIISSNRSCIMQVQNRGVDGQLQEDRVTEMDGWLQFRFAQGSPDKEDRFIRSVQETSQRLGQRQKVPTIFAFHGSPLENWHTIIRQGLHFKRTDHGRAFGHGVYHHLMSTYSMGYARGGKSWPNSGLQVESALSLNELVNAPKEFVTSANQIFVVAQLDWIQTRYLFARCKAATLGDVAPAPPNPCIQDEVYRPHGITGKHVLIPAKATSQSRQNEMIAIKTNDGKKMKAEVRKSEDVDDSDQTDVEDYEIFMDDVDMSLSEIDPNIKSFEPDSKKRSHEDANTTEYKNMHYNTTQLHLPILAPPSYASTQATQALQRELRQTLKIQNKQPRDELGWTINTDYLENIYQWIVEFHSFPPELPLAKDMAKQNIKSIVFEVRFGANYPHSPPFVRVIRPRFLPGFQGGGGHVNQGGAMCMELLTNNGWSPVTAMEMVFFQIRCTIMTTEPKAARLVPGHQGDYSMQEAFQAYRRACEQHNWEMPKDFAAFMSNNQFAVEAGPSGPNGFQTPPQYMPGSFTSAF
ncbi:MAG: hypothetical protein MMC33_009464 [Icmadophila ericetorum]|nr:hypothetical protein [Icmadophila ericetorum]